MASSPDFYIRKQICSNCGELAIDGFCEFCEEEIIETPTLDEYNVFDETEGEDEE